jgi:endonuclease III
MNVNRILAVLDRWIPDPQIPLKFSDPFTLLIAVILSAQCTDERVNRITEKLFQVAHTPQQMAQLDPKEIETIIRPCGLALTKSRVISQLSRDLMQHHHGQVPRTLKSLEKLPGVGHKTASVVLIHAFHKSAFPVDTHIHRCAKRWGLSNGKSVIQTEQDLKKLFPKRRWARIHLQMILFARKFCPARGHQPHTCPICREL